MFWWRWAPKPEPEPELEPEPEPELEPELDPTLTPSVNLSVTLVQVNGLDLKGEHVGGTAPKVQNYFRAARGGMLFVDEVGAAWPSSQPALAPRHVPQAPHLHLVP